MDYKMIERIMNLRSKFYIEIRLFDRARWIAAKMGYKQSFYYTPVDESKTLLLDHELFKIKKFFEQCKKHLKLPSLWIQWVEEDTERNYRIFGGLKSDEPLLGEADIKSGNKISIRADISFDDILRTVAHECHHHWFYKKWGKTRYWSDKGMREGTADRFAKKMLCELREWEQFEKDENLQLVYASRRNWN